MKRYLAPTSPSETGLLHFGGQWSYHIIEQFISSKNMWLKIETIIHKHDENPILGMQKSKQGDYVCDVINSNLRAYEHIIWIKTLKHARTKSNLHLTC